jgi:tetratricopeptide (TPR) repeat protein
VAKGISSSNRLSLVDGETFSKSFLQVIQEHTAVVTGGLVGIILLSVGIFFWGYQKRVGLDELRTGIRALQSGDATKAVTQLRHIGRAYLGSTERSLGLFYLGEAYATQGDIANAVNAYEEALTASKNNNEENLYLQQVIFLKLGQTAEQQGNLAQARQRYEQAGGIEGPVKTEAIAAAARTVEKSNDPSAAATYYEKLLAQSPESPLAEVFQKRAGK